MVFSYENSSYEKATKTYNIIFNELSIKCRMLSLSVYTACMLLGNFPFCLDYLYLKQKLPGLKKYWKKDSEQGRKGFREVSVGGLFTIFCYYFILKTHKASKRLTKGIGCTCFWSLNVFFFIITYMKLLH